MTVSGHARGLDPDGALARDGELGRVQREFAPLVDAARRAVARTFGSRLHSAYVYGSVPRGTARPGSSDLDLLLALHREPTPRDRADAAAVEGALDARFVVIDGAGALLFGTGRLLSARERYDLGWFVACMCTPLLGEDLAERLPRYRPTALLARETNGDLARLLPVWRERAAALAAGGTDEARARLVRSAARKLVRTGMSLVMPWWQGWTSELAASAEQFARYYPERAEQMRWAARLAVDGGAGVPGDTSWAPVLLVDDLGPWLAAEFASVHGEKAAGADP